MEDVLVFNSEYIKSIDKRITSSHYEKDEDGVYCKIWFDYQMNSYSPVMKDGRQEFLEDTDELLIDEIKNFLDDPTHNFIIK